MKNSLCFIAIAWVVLGVSSLHAAGENTSSLWSDLPYEEWPVFKEEEVKIGSVKVKYLDTKIDAYLDPDPRVIWIDNEVFIVSYTDNKDGKIRLYSRLFDVKSSALRDYIFDAAVEYFDGKNNILGLKSVKSNGHGFEYIKIKVSPDQIRSNLKVEGISYVKNNSFSDVNCYALSAPLESRFYWAGEECKRYLVLKRKTDGMNDLSIRLHDSGHEALVRGSQGVVSSSDFLLPKYYQFLDKVAFKAMRQAPSAGRTIMLLDREAKVELIRFPPQKITGTGFQGSYKKEFSNVLDIQPVGAGLLVTTSKHTYLFGPNSVAVLSAPSEKVVTWGGAVSISMSPDGCMTTYVSRLKHGIGPFSYFDKPSLKIKNYCQGEPK